VLRVDSTSDVSLTEQIRRGIRRAISEGDVEPGDDLPPVRQLAADLQVNLNTVARAYRELEREGLVSTVRGRGTVVAAERSRQRVPRGELRGRVRDLVADARLSGYRRADIEKLVLKELRRGAW